MISIYNAALSLQERRAFRLMIEDLSMDVIGEADNWPDVLEGVSSQKPDAIVVDWDLLVEAGHSLVDLRSICPPETVLILVSSLSPTQQAAISAGADIFICRDDTPDRVALCLQSIALYK